MMYKLKIIEDKNIWNDFIEKNNFPFYSFLSSWEWWEFKKDFWFPVLRYGIYRKKSEEGSEEIGRNWKKEELIGVLPMIKTKAKRWTYLFVPHTPLIINNEKSFNQSWNPDQYYFDVLREKLNWGEVKWLRGSI